MAFHGQASPEIMSVMAVAAMGLLVSVYIYSGQSANLSAFNEQRSARIVALDLCIAANDAYALGNGSYANVTVPQGYNATVTQNTIRVTYGSAIIDCRKPPVPIVPQSFGGGSYVMSYDGEVLSLA